ncbi:MAG: hypothetical protein JWN44_4282 [Myxococcales bacterium]|nr:hypothetical protein [Myxococcales bacterium]
MRRIALILALALVPAAPSLAKKKPPKSSAQTSQKEGNKAPPPNDKRTNEGAQGRMNATEDAAKDADSSQFQHRP